MGNTTSSTYLSNESEKPMANRYQLRILKEAYPENLSAEDVDLMDRSRAAHIIAQAISQDLIFKDEGKYYSFTFE